MQRLARISAAVLITFLALGLVTGCGGGEEPVSPTQKTAIEKTASGAGAQSAKAALIEKLRPDPSSLEPTASGGSAQPDATKEEATTKVVSEPMKRPEPSAVEPAPGEAELRAKLKKTVDDFAAAVIAGDAERAGTFFASEAQYKKLLTSGAFSILGSTLPAQNQKELKDLLEVLKGKKVTHTFEDGKLTVQGKASAAFRVAAPMVSQAAVSFAAEGDPAPYRIQLEQMIWVDGDWRIFNIQR